VDFVKAAKQAASSAEEIIRSFVAVSDNKQGQTAFKAPPTYPYFEIYHSIPLIQSD
jgi:hypothetical protein